VYSVIREIGNTLPWKSGSDHLQSKREEGSINQQEDGRPLPLVARERGDIRIKGLKDEGLRVL
jgi:hypothetical protein